MKLIIEIPDGLYKEIHNIHNGSIASACVLQAAKNGTPLPKCHGRLVDADALKGKQTKQFQIVPNGNGKFVESAVYYQEHIDNAPTIIEADKDGEA